MTLHAAAFPATPDQIRLWMQHRISPHTSAYHVAVGLRIDGHLDLARLRTAADLLVAGHDALRTTFRFHEGRVEQLVRQHATASFQIAEAGGGDAARVATDLVMRPFDLQRGPLLRFVVVRTESPVHHLLVVCASHMVVDGRSMTVLVRRLQSLYLNPTAASPSVADFPDYAAWRAELPDEPCPEGLVALLPKASAPFGLCPEAARPALDAPCRAFARQLDTGTVAGLDRLAMRCRTTPMAVTTAAVLSTLGAMTRRADPVVLLTLDGRDTPGTDSMVGHFATTVPFGGAPLFGDVPALESAIRGTELVEATAAGLNTIRGGHAVGLDRLAERLAPRRVPGHLPFSDVLFVYQDPLPTTVCFGDATAYPLELGLPNAKSELCLEFRPAGITAALHLNVRADTIPDRVAMDLLEDLSGVLDRLIERPSATIGSITTGCRPFGGAGEPGRGDGPMPSRGGDSRPLGAVIPAEPPSTDRATVDLTCRQAEPVIRKAGSTAGTDSDLRGRIRSAMQQTLDGGAAAAGDDLDTTDFFEMGGNSLLAMRLLADLERSLGVDLPLRDFLADPTIRGLNAMVAAAEPESAPTPSAAVSGPMTAEQCSLWLAHINDTSAIAYNCPVAIDTGPDLDLDVLQQAVDAVVSAHPTLRTGFEMAGSIPNQRIHDSVAVPVSQRHVGSRQELERLLRRLGRLPFDLQSPPLLRVDAVKHEGWTILITAHHVLLDESSAHRIAADLSVAYDRLRGGHPPEIAVSPLTMLDLAGHQQRAGQGYPQLRQNWHRRLSGLTAAQPLVPAEPVPVGADDGQGLDTVDVPFEVPPPTVATLRRLAQSGAGTMFHLLAAALATVVGRYTDTDDVCIGGTMSTRHGQWSDLIGYMATTVPIRISIAGTVRERIIAARRSCEQSLAAAALPSQQIATAADVDGPLFRAVLALAGTPPALTFAGQPATARAVDISTSRFDLAVMAQDNGHTLVGVVRSRFGLAAARRFTDHLLRAVDQLAGADTDLLSDTERRAQLVDRNAAVADYRTDTTLPDLVAARVDAGPDAWAVDGVLRYRDLQDRALSMQHRLLQAGVRPGDVVAVAMQREPDLLVATLAVMRCGAGYLPIDPAGQAPRTKKILDDARCRVVVARATLQVPGDWSIVSPDGPFVAAAEPPVQLATPDDPAYVVFTSGSTGRPKGVVVTHRSAVNNLQWMQQQWPLSSSDRMLFKTTPTFDVAIKEMFWPLVAGATMSIAPPGQERDATAIVKFLERGVTVAHLVPSVLDAVLAAIEPAAAEPASDRRFGSLRLLMCGAEAVAPALLRRLFDRCDVRLIHMYGPSETAISVTGWSGTTVPPGRRLPLGRALPGGRCYLLDRQLRPAPDGAIAELWIGGIPVGPGYLAAPRATSERYLPDPFAGGSGSRMYRTGDLARYRPDGQLEFVGRRDAQVKIRGVRVEPGEVQRELLRVAGVRAAVVRSWCPRPGRPVELIGYVVPDPTASVQVDENHLRHCLLTRLPAAFVPRFIECVPDLPVTVNGKVDTDALPTPQALRSAGGRTDGGPLPAEGLEQQLAALWGELLEVSGIGRESRFFDLGGHSLVATRLAVLIEQRLGVRVPLDQLMAAPSLADHAAVVAAAARTADGSAALPSAPILPSRRTHFRVDRAELEQLPR